MMKANYNKDNLVTKYSILIILIQILQIQN